MARMSEPSRVTRLQPETSNSSTAQQLTFTAPLALDFRIKSKEATKTSL